MLKLAKAKLELANFLWLENNIPLELSDDLIPEYCWNSPFKRLYEPMIY
jgi:hypothetical protein